MNLFNWKNVAIVLSLALVYVLFIKKPDEPTTATKKCSCKDKKAEEQPE